MLQVRPEQLLDLRYTPSGAAKVLVKWQGLPERENSWELFNTLQTQIPDARLEDKVVLFFGPGGRGSVRDLLYGQVYVRRNRRNKGWAET